MLLKQTLPNIIQKILSLTRSLRDIRIIGQVIFVGVVLLVSWSGVKAIDTNYELQKQIAGLEQENKLQELENTNLQLQNQYYNSNQYLELSARQNFGLGARGEKEILVPKSVALAYTVPVPQATEEAKSTAEPPAYQRNIQAWVDFFLHRHNESWGR